MGLGKSRSTSLIEKLYWKRKQSDIPWFIPAAYHAFDHILINIDAFEGKEELNRLEALYKNLSEKEGKDFHEGVQTRMEWTIDRLKERVVGHWSLVQWLSGSEGERVRIYLFFGHVCLDFFRILPFVCLDFFRWFAQIAGGCPNIN
jgi:hypothetical protein